MFIRLYRKNKLVVTIPVDEVHMSIDAPRGPDTYNTGQMVYAKSEFLRKRYSAKWEYMNIAFINSYGQWRLCDKLSVLIGARTGVTFSHLEVV